MCIWCERGHSVEDNDKLKAKVADDEIYIAKLLKEKTHLQDQSLKKLETIAGKDVYLVSDERIYF